MCLFRPLCAIKTPHNTKYNHENVDKSQNLGCVLHNNITSRLDYCRIQCKAVESRDEVSINKT